MLLNTFADDDLLVIRVSVSRLDFTNVNSFKNAMIDELNKEYTKICVDMQNVEFMDSRGLSTFLTLLRLVGKEGVMCLTNVKEPLRKMFSITKTDRVVKIAPDMQEAIAYLRQS